MTNRKGCAFHAGPHHRYRLHNVGRNSYMTTPVWMRAVVDLPSRYELVATPPHASLGVWTISDRLVRGNGERAVWRASEGTANQQFSVGF